MFTVHIEETVVGWRNQLSDENLRYITPGTSLVNEAPPMPLRASSHPGSPNSPSCSALAWYSCWPGLSPWGESGDWTPVARTAALTRCRYATQLTNLRTGEYGQYICSYFGGDHRFMPCDQNNVAVLVVIIMMAKSFKAALGWPFWIR